MNIAHLHLALNHFPIVGSVIVALMLVASLVRRSDELGKFALALATLVGVLTLAVFFTGEPTEELVEHLPGFSESITERHEAIALIATIVVGALGAMAVGVLLSHRRRVLSRRLTAMALSLALVASGIMGYTAFLGGQVRHAEVRPATATLSPGSVRGDDDH